MFSRSTLEILTLVALVVATLSVGVALYALQQLGRVRRSYEAVRDDPAVLSGVDPRAVRNVAVVRYDAFADMGGRMSHSVALLDSAGDGVVLTAINGRSETRAYAKGIVGGASEHSLSPEEQQAVDAALGRAGRHARK